MKSYNKISENNSFLLQRSNFNKEFVFVESDFDSLSLKSTNKKHHSVHEQDSSIPDQVNNKKVGFFLGKSEVATASFESELDDYDGRNHHSFKQFCSDQIASANPSYHKKNNIENNNSCLEKKSSSRSIQKAVKKVFSIKRPSDKYCKIYDQPNMNFDDYNSNDYANNDDMHNIYDHQDDEIERNGSLDTRYASMKNTYHNHGRSHAGSKVVRACKRLFRR